MRKVSIVLHVFYEILDVPEVKKLSFISLETAGRLVGFSCSIFATMFMAGLLMCCGVLYCTCLILEYVSFRLDVSKGGLPTSRVYIMQPMLHTSASYECPTFVSTSGAM